MRWTIVLMMLAVSLSGCFADDEAPSPGEGEEPTDPGNGNETGSPENVTSPPPVARLNVTPVNGSAPLLVNFTLDAEGNWTHWVFDFGDGNATNGTTLPTVLNATYLNGTWNVTYRVFGPGGNTSAVASLNVTGGGADVLVLEPFQETVDIVNPCPGCKAGTATCLWRQHGQDAARDCGWIDYPDEYIGHPFTLTGSGLDPDVLFWNACNSGAGTRFDTDLSEEEGIIPDGQGCALVWEAVDPLVTVTLTITPA